MEDIYPLILPRLLSELSTAQHSVRRTPLTNTPPPPELSVSLIPACMVFFILIILGTHLRKKLKARRAGKPKGKDKNDESNDARNGNEASTNDAEPAEVCHM